MKKTDLKKKLSLRTETLRALSGENLSRARGGLRGLWTFTCTCPTQGDFTCDDLKEP